MLSEFDLPTTGDKETLAARHQRYDNLDRGEFDYLFWLLVQLGYSLQRKSR